MQKIRNLIKRQISDDFDIKRVQIIWILVILGAVSGGMSVLNVFTHKHTLLIATTVFAVFSFGSALVGYLDKKSVVISSILFSVEMIALFTYFIIFGGTEGFSTLWLLLLPACGCFAFGSKKGSILSFVVFAELIFFFCTNTGRGLIRCTAYTKSFCQRFPIMYFAFFIVGLFLEIVRDETYKQLVKTREEYEYLSKHDVLTGLYNRVGFNLEMDKCFENITDNNIFALLILDIDYFKTVNDNYGHNIGDMALKTVAKKIENCIVDQNAIACRWGGEEFAILIHEKSVDYIREIGESIRTSVAVPMKFGDVTVAVTSSLGGTCSKDLEKISASKLVSTADNQLYAAKNAGRNRVCIYKGETAKTTKTANE